MKRTFYFFVMIIALIAIVGCSHLVERWHSHGNLLSDADGQTSLSDSIFISDETNDTLFLSEEENDSLFISEEINQDEVMNSDAESDYNQFSKPSADELENGVSEQGKKQITTNARGWIKIAEGEGSLWTISKDFHENDDGSKSFKFKEELTTPQERLEVKELYNLGKTPYMSIYQIQFNHDWNEFRMLGWAVYDQEGMVIVQDDGPLPWESVEPSTLGREYVSCAKPIYEMSQSSHKN